MNDCYNISICKKGKVKDETSKNIHETNGGQIKEEDVQLTWDSPQVCLLFSVKKWHIKKVKMSRILKVTKDKDVYWKSNNYGA